MQNSSILMNKLCANKGIVKNKLILHSDNGDPMKGATILATLDKLRVAASFSRPRVSNDNSYSESLFKTLKYCPKYPCRFKSLSEAKQ
jgi:putative transposase